jgi:hypothetical protein
MPPVWYPKNPMAQITTRMTAIMYNKLPTDFVFKLLINKIYTQR